VKWSYFGSCPGCEYDDFRRYAGTSFIVPPNDHKFPDFIQLSDLGDKPDDQDVLRYALGREQAAMEQYDALANEVPPGPVAQLFRYLANEELEHKRELEKMYHEIVHSGGV
jgi:hypothetical protein